MEKIEKMEKFTEAEKLDYENLCKLVDFDQSGTLELSEFNTVTRALGIKLNEAEFAHLKKTCDTEDTGFINNAEFIQLMELSNSKTEYETEMLECFRAIDKNNDGMISIEDISNLFRILKIKNYDEDKVMSIIDTDCDSFVSFDEFVKFLIAK